MKNLYIILFFLLAGTQNNFAQPGALDKEDESPFIVSQDREKKLLQIEYSGELSTLEIKLKDKSGKVVYSESITEKKARHNRTINLTSYAQGVYFLEVDSERMQEVDRIEL
jgi:hypothetical protein